MKPTEIEVKYLDSLIDKLSLNNNELKLYVLPFFKNIIDNLKKDESKKNQIANIIEEIIKSSNRSINLSLSRITNEFKTMSDIKNIRPIKKSSIHNIMKNILGYKYRKTTVKNGKLTEKKSIKFSFFYLKVLLRALIIGLNIIYIDESGFYSHNNNYYTWRLKDEEIFYPRNDNKKRI